MAFCEEAEANGNTEPPQREAISDEPRLVEQDLLAGPDLTQTYERATQHPQVEPVSLLAH